MPSTKIAQMVYSAKQKGHQSSRQEMSLNDISWTTDPKSTIQEAENASSFDRYHLFISYNYYLQQTTSADDIFRCVFAVLQLLTE